MKYVLAVAAALAAVAALVFRPPHAEPAQPRPARLAAVTRSRPATPAATPLVVYVAGEVVRPGVYGLRAGARGADALARAGGPKPDADLVAVNLAAPVRDGDEIAVPRIGAAPARSPRRPAARVRRPRATRAHRTDPPPAVVDLNAATESELQSLPGVGAALAARIAAFREVNGPFTSIDELADVAGISPHAIDVLTPFVTVR